MEYYEISVPDRNDSVMRVNLDGTYYYLRVTWNAYGEFWMLSIYDADMQMKNRHGKARAGSDLELLLSQLERSAGNPWRSNRQGTHRQARFR